MELLVRPEAETDLAHRGRWYRREGEDGLGDRFLRVADEALDAILLLPGAGSPRYQDLCEVPDLRTWRIEGFPCGWFYVVRDTYVDVIRLLSYAQDLPQILGSDDTI